VGDVNLWSRAIGGHEKIEARVRIGRPVGEVFEFYRDFRNLPRFLGDVMSVEPTGEKTSRWTIQGPARMRIRWEMEVIEEQPDSVIRYRTNSLHGLDTTWNVYFGSAADDPGSTEVREVMDLPLGKVGLLGMALVGKPPADEVAANLHRLKQLMETGRVTDTSHAVPGKFEGARSP
jgi:uncharacterized membrane protein